MLKIMLSAATICTLCVLMVFSQISWAQNIDSLRISLKSKSKKVNRTPEIKANVQPYKAFYIPSGFNLATSAALLGKNTSSANPAKQEKNLTVLRVYPNPVETQLNLTIRLERESSLSVKIIDLLGNEIITLSNERTPAGEQTKTYSIPPRLNAGIYFLKIAAGTESVVKRISIL